MTRPLTDHLSFPASQVKVAQPGTVGADLAEDGELVR
jgi:hypothetical protein